MLENSCLRTDRGSWDWQVNITAENVKGDALARGTDYEASRYFAVTTFQWRSLDGVAHAQVRR